MDTKSHKQFFTDELSYDAAREIVDELTRHDTDNADSDTEIQIDGYTIDKLIGRGGGGSVYLGTRDGSTRLLAVKVFHHKLGNEKAMRRIWREVELLTDIRLDSVPRILDHGVTDGRLYVATEFIDGIPITDYCNSNDLDLKQRVQLLADVCDAVQKLHEYGVIHRDLKPTNILIDQHGKPAIIDFGIATFLDSDNHVTLTEDGEPMGSPAFMSPEQARGERNKITTQSDVYSLGATAYAVLLGQTPHESDTTQSQMELMHKVGFDEPRDPRGIDGTLPKPLCSVLRKAVAREMGERYCSVLDLANDLRRWIKREPVQAGKQSIWIRCVRTVARHPVATTAATCVLIALLSISMTYVSVWYLNSRPYEVVLSSDRKQARLLSVSGNLIHAWDTEQPGGIYKAIFGTTDVTNWLYDAVVISYVTKYAGGKNGFLEVYDIDTDYRKPTWTDRITNSDIPDQFLAENINANGFGVPLVLLADIFPERDSTSTKELLAIFQHERAVSVLRIYDSNGIQLFEVWHDGNMQGVIWMPKPARLVICGLNAEGLWPERGFDQLFETRHPKVIFAVSPNLGLPAKLVVNTGENLGEFEPDWYKGFLPPKAIVAVGSIIFTPGQNTMGDSFQVNMSFLESDAGLVEMTISADGELLESPFPNTDYLLLANKGNSKLPKPSIFSLGPLPPIEKAVDE